MFKILQSKKFLIVLGFIVLIFVLFAFFTSKNSAPQLLSSNPPNNTTRFSVINPVELQFQAPVSPLDFTVSSTPEASWQISSKDGSSLSISHTTQLSQTTKYTLNVAWKNKNIKTLVFTTEATQTDYTLIQDIKTEVARDYPIAQFIPYDTSFYRVVYSAPLTLEITIKNPNIKSADAIADIKTWVTSVGGDAAAHQYVVAAAVPKP